MMILTLSYEFFMVCLLQQRLQNIKQSQREFNRNALRCYIWQQLNTTNT